MEESLSLRILALFLTLLASLLGVGVPLHLGKNFPPETMKSHFGFSILRSFSAGIMVGVAFIHLLADAASNLPILVPDYPALAFTLTTLGIIFVLALENIILSSIKPSHQQQVSDQRSFHSSDVRRSNSDKSINDFHTIGDEPGSTNSFQHNHHIQDCDGKLCKDIEAVGQDVLVASAAVKFKHEAPSIAGCKHSHSVVTVNLLADSRGIIVLIKAYLMEIAIAIHSIIIGVSMGMMGPDEISTLRALIIAMCFHQFFEGVGLGAVMSYVRIKLGPIKVMIFAIVFGTTLSLGILIGIFVSTLEGEHSESHLAVTSCANAIAAGTLVYIGLVEILAEEFSGPELEDKHSQKLSMAVSFAMGVFVMALLAIWA